MSQLDIETGPLTPGQIPCVVCNLDDRTRAASDPDDLRCHECRAFDKARESGQFMRMVPQAVNAVQWSGTAHDAHRVITWADKKGVTVTYRCANDADCAGGGSGHYLQLGLLRVNMPNDRARLAASDWLVEVPSGYVQAYSNADFRREFVPVDAELMRKA